MILTIRTDNPQAEIGLFTDTGEQLAYNKWLGHRQLSKTILQEIHELMQSVNSDWESIKGIICYQGPGSFTGLRIGASLANTLGASLSSPVIGASGENWIKKGIQEIKNKKEKKIIIPNYGRQARITRPRK